MGNCIQELCVTDSQPSQNKVVTYHGIIFMSIYLCLFSAKKISISVSANVG